MYLSVVDILFYLMTWKSDILNIKENIAANTEHRRSTCRNSMQAIVMM